MTSYSKSNGSNPKGLLTRECVMNDCQSMLISEIKTTYKYLFGPVRTITLRNYATGKTVYLFGDVHTEYTEIKHPEDVKTSDNKA